MQNEEKRVLETFDIIVSQYEVCGYALVVSFTAISLSDAGKRRERLRLFKEALDHFEAGLFEASIGRAKAAAALELAGAEEGDEEDIEVLRARLKRVLARRPGRA